jgi:hypothetical protein
MCPPWVGKPVVLCSLCRSMYSAIRKSERLQIMDGEGEGTGDGKMKSVSSKEKENFVRQRIRTTL